MTRWWTGFGVHNMAFERVVLPEDWRSAMIVPLYKVKKERMECTVIIEVLDC